VEYGVRSLNDEGSG